jgi:hypothetical protein
LPQPKILDQAAKASHWLTTLLLILLQGLRQRKKVYNFESNGKCHKHFFFLTDKKARVFVPGKPAEPGLMLTWAGAY